MRRELDEALRALSDELRRVTVQVRTPAGRQGRGESAGSGVVWRTDGLVVTNAHVARGERALVELYDGRTLPARRVAVDGARDLSALRVDAHGLEAAAQGAAAHLRPGDLVVALGNPLGWVGALGLGVVHGVDRFHGAPRWIRADVRLAPGNSGGPLANASGAVVGLNAMVVGELGVAIPTEAVERFLADPGARPVLGVSLRPVVARDVRGDAPALLVTGVRAGGAAARAGLRPGDALLGVDGEPFAQAIDLGVALEGLHPGDVLPLDVFREGRRARRDVSLEPERALEVEVA